MESVILYDDVVCCDTKEVHDKELEKLIDKYFKDVDVEVDCEFRGPGLYRFKARKGRPEGIPLVSLKWVWP